MGIASTWRLISAQSELRSTIRQSAFPVVSSFVNHVVIFVRRSHAKSLCTVSRHAKCKSLRKSTATQHLPCAWAIVRLYLHSQGRKRDGDVEKLGRIEQNEAYVLSLLPTGCHSSCTYKMNKQFTAVCIHFVIQTLLVSAL